MYCRPGEWYGCSGSVTTTCNPLAFPLETCHTTCINERQDMNFQVTAIEFDFGDATAGFEQEAFEEGQVLVQQTIGQIWEADDEDDLVEEITCATGWCIKSIDYRHVLV